MSTSSNFLIIPIRIEGLCLDHPKQVVSPIADFSKLPWSNGTEDFNFSQPFVSNGVLREPFEEPGLILEKGVHLHFIVPHFLGQAIPNLKNLANVGDLPAAPNRWLVTIENDGITQFMVESDYVHEASYPADNSSCVIPSSSDQPFRYMGRKTALNASRTAGTDFKTFTGKELTVLGYGDINFSSFYPNCMGAFGFHDPSGSAGGVSYKVLGWHENADDDILSQFIIQAMTNDGSITFAELNEKLSDGFNLELGGSALPSNTVRTLFYGEFTADSQNSAVDLSPLEIAMGHTGTEALAAHLANEMAAGDATEKQTIEEQIEAALMNDQLDPLKVDTAPKFLEGRHTKGFRPINASDLWQITTSSAKPNPSPVDNSTPPMILPASLEQPLDALNNLQQQYDAAQNQIESLQEQLYSDWYRYMHTRYTPLEARGQYPDADHVMNFVKNGSLNELNQLIASTGTVTFGEATAGNLPTTTSASTTLAGQLVTAWTTLNGLIGDQNTTRTTGHLPNLQLALLPGPRYWEAHDPVIMISGLDQASTGTNPTLAQSITATPISSSQTVSAQSLSTSTAGDVLTQCSGTSMYALSTQQWSPFILDWQVDLEGIHLKQSSGNFSADGLNTNYKLNPYGPDFLNNSEAPGKLSVFSGTVLMSSHAKHSLQQQIKSFLKDFFKKNKIGFNGTNTIDTFLAAPAWWASGSTTDAYNVLDIPSTFTQISTDTTYATNPIYTLWEGYGKLKNKEVISQTLNGFNEACIMQKKVPQIPIMEPLGFEYEKLFTASVATAVGNHRSMSPVTAFQFNPIRGGNLSFNQLDLIDNFGTVHTLDTSTIKVVNSETISDSAGDTKLLPRLSQAARINFRWLSAQTGISETNIHPGSSPICGWLTADYINNSIAVYAPDGTALGAIDSQAKWTVPPWNLTSTLSSVETAYPYLYKVVEKISASATFLADFISAAQNAQRNIAPADAHLYTTKSILMGKPMAVVRAKLSFETKGLPVIDQSWASLLTDISNFDQNMGSYSSRNNDAWTEVKLPIRIGDHHQLNDGLIGYWTEDSSGTLGSQLIAPETTSDSVSDAAIDTFSGTNYQCQTRSFADEPLALSMLIDPRGLVHATTGILPTKAISIPQEYWLPALEKMMFWFFTSPILQPKMASKVSMNLPKVQGYDWKWWDIKNGEESIVSDNGVMASNEVNQLRDGWLYLKPQPPQLTNKKKKTT